MPTLKLKNISKGFPGVQALDTVEITFYPGEIHALCGENGAGKSTLMNILVGNLQPDEGIIFLDDKEVIIKDAKEAAGAGIAIVYQHLSLVESMSVAENIFANQQPVNSWGMIQYDELYKRSDLLLKELNIGDIDPRTLVGKLSQGQKQMVEIAKAFSKEPSILILDEPTASIAEKETKILFRILTKLREQGVSIVYISHRLEEIFLLSDKTSILKDGKCQGTFPTKELSREMLIQKMVGREISALKTETTCHEEILLRVKKLTGSKFKNISFDIRKGEIVGLSGLVGAGRTEIARTIFGADQFVSGEIYLNSKVIRPKHPSEAVALGIAYVPEDRKSLGLFPEMSVQANIAAAELSKSSSGAFYNENKANEWAMYYKKQLRIVSHSLKQKVINLSGGNQQKVVLAKWLLTNPVVLIIDEPTHGVDVGAKFELYEVLKSLAAEGKGILIISSDLPELLGLCDRILVINKGRLVGEVLRDDAKEENIMALAAN